MSPSESIKDVPKSDNNSDVDVNVTSHESMGIIVLGFLFLLVLLALLRTQKRERKLLREIATMHAQKAK